MSSEQGTASAVSSAAPSPQPLHNPSQAAVVQPPQAPLGAPKVGATVVGAGHKALLAKKMAKSSNPSIISPTDNMVTPVSAKLSQAKKKHFLKNVKPLSFDVKQQGGTTNDDDDE